jgi:hypothetical protein
MLDKFNIFFAAFGVVAVVVGLLAHILLLVIIVGLAFVVTFIVIAILDKSIKWPAWRVVIAISLVFGLLAFQYVPPKTEAFQIYMPDDFSGWTATSPPLYYYPVSDNPQTGHQYSNYTLDPGNTYDVNVRCWTSGRLTGKPHIAVDWVSIKGGSYDGLWIPFEAIADENPGLARDLPNCNSWWFRVWPF